MNEIVTPLHENKQAAKRANQRTETAIAELIDERQKMLISFCQVAGLEPYTPDKPISDSLREFLQRLVDYIALGHFEVYQCMEKDNQQSPERRKLAREVYPNIIKAASAALAFNDKYDQPEHDDLLPDLTEDLSKLGEQLAIRLELEDQLIQATQCT